MKVDVLGGRLVRRFGILGRNIPSQRKFVTSCSGGVRSRVVPFHKSEPVVQPIKKNEQCAPLAQISPIVKQATPPIPFPRGENDEMWKRFDYIGVVCYTGYKDRYIQLVKELDRVGIHDFHAHWDFPSPYKNILMDKVRMVPWNKRGNGFFIGLNNYRVLATAYNLGKNSCLVLEDDIRFLKDVKKISEIVKSLSEDYDLAMLDHNDPTRNDKNYLSNFSTRVNPYWAAFHQLSSSGFYAMSNRGMKRFLDLYESPVKSKGTLHPNDMYFNSRDFGPDMKLYAACTCPAIQKTYAGCHGESYMVRYNRLHELLGMKQDEYQNP